MAPLRSAGYQNDVVKNGPTIGDPALLPFTEMLRECFGYEREKKGHFDHLPLVCQVDPHQPPEVFEIPPTFLKDVDIWHPDYPFLAELGLKWYPVPAVNALDLTVGGISYTCAPFNGWYADVEVVRDLCDETRYDVLPKVAALMGLDTNKESFLWRDEAQLVINKAVIHSFGHAQISMVDHHTLIRNFVPFYEKELKTRGYCPGNWKWIIPPQASATSPAYLGLNKMTEYTLRPAYLYAPGWKKYREQFWPVDSQAKVKRYLCYFFCVTRFLGKAMHIRRRNCVNVLVVYASVSGNTKKFAGKVVESLYGMAQLTVLSAENFRVREPEAFDYPAERASLVIVMSSTYGSGDPPACAEALHDHLLDGVPGLRGKPYAVVGFGSSQYPKFCGGAEQLDDAMQGCGARRMLPLAKCDAQGGEVATFNNWFKDLIMVMSSERNASPAFMRLAINYLSQGPVTKQPIHLRTRFLSEKESAALAMQKMIYGNYPAAEGASWEGKPGETKLVVKLIEETEKDLQSTDDRPKRSAGYKAYLDGAGLQDKSRRRAERERVAKAKAAVKKHQWLLGSVKGVEQLLPGEMPSATNFQRATTLVKIDLSLCGAPQYHPGDHLVVEPRNVIDKETLAEFCKNMNIKDLDQVFFVDPVDQGKPISDEVYPLLSEIIGRPNTIRNLFMWDAALREPGGIDQDAAAALSKLAVEEDALHLENISKDVCAYDDEKRRSGLAWLELFHLFPSLKGRVPLGLALNYIPRNRPRYYSISSARDVVGNEVHVAVGRLVYQLGDGKKRKGMASDFLCQLSEGDPVRFNLHTDLKFHLPSENLAPIVLCAAGTGIAPFRGYWQQRSALIARGVTLGPCALVFGCRQESEFLFRDEVKMAESTGAITHLLIAYSREPGTEKQYVQDVFKAKADVLRPMIQHPMCCVYVCGQHTMPNNIRTAIAEVGGDGLVLTMEDEDRIHDSVFGVLATSDGRPHDQQTWRESRGFRPIQRRKSSLGLRRGSFGRSTDEDMSLPQDSTDLNVFSLSGNSVASPGGSWHGASPGASSITSPRD